MFQFHPPYTFLQSLECRYKQAVVGRVLAGLCLCPYLAERCCQAVLRGTCTQFQSSPSLQEASAAVTSSVASQRRALCAHRERQAMLYNSLPPCQWPATASCLEGSWDNWKAAAYTVGFSQSSLGDTGEQTSWAALGQPRSSPPTEMAGRGKHREKVLCCSSNWWEDKRSWN